MHDAASPLISWQAIKRSAYSDSTYSSLLLSARSSRIHVPTTTKSASLSETSIARYVPINFAKFYCRFLILFLLKCSERLRWWNMRLQNTASSSLCIHLWTLWKSFLTHWCDFLYALFKQIKYCIAVPWTVNKYKFGPYKALDVGVFTGHMS